MIQRDYIMRQVHQLAQVLARVMGLSGAGRQTEGSELLSRAVEDVTGVDLERLRKATDSELVELCSPTGDLSAELAVALADIMIEDAHHHESVGNARAARAIDARAMYLYSLVHEAGGVLPMEVLRRLTDSSPR